jgi:hypothetical protein
MRKRRRRRRVGTEIRQVTGKGMLWNFVTSCSVQIDFRSRRRSELIVKACEEGAVG